jgi:Arc/MetJ-type ribon-helix-helix transcriptional regulator
VFDKRSRTVPAEDVPPEGRVGPEDERIALRCRRKELQLLDSFVASGEFRSRSELMRGALLAFLRARTMSALTTPALSEDPRGLVEVAVRLRKDEVETLRAYGDLVANGQAMEDLLAMLVRRGEIELKVSETVERSRASVRAASETRNRIKELGRTGRELERRGVVGR